MLKNKMNIFLIIINIILIVVVIYNIVDNDKKIMRAYSMNMQMQNLIFQELMAKNSEQDMLVKILKKNGIDLTEYDEIAKSDKEAFNAMYTSFEDIYNEIPYYTSFKKFDNFVQKH